MLKTNWTHIKYKTQAELFGSACALFGTPDRSCLFANRQKVNEA